MRGHAHIVEPAEDELATREVRAVQFVLPNVRLPRRRPPGHASAAQPVRDLDDLPTVLLPAVRHDPELEMTALLPVPATASCSATPTTHRPEPMRFCYQCGAVIPPWRESCFVHEQYHGRGLPPPVHLEPIASDDVAARFAGPLHRGRFAIIRPSRRVGPPLGISRDRRRI